MPVGYSTPIPAPPVADGDDDGMFRDDPVLALLAPGQGDLDLSPMSIGYSADPPSQPQPGDLPDLGYSTAAAGPVGGPNPNGSGPANGPGPARFAPPPVTFPGQPRHDPKLGQQRMPKAFSAQPDPNNAGPMGQNRILKPMNALLVGENQVGVKYIDDLKVRRAKYQVEMAATMRRRGMEFDTKEIRTHFFQKGWFHANGDRRPRVATASLGANRHGTPFGLPNEWLEGGMIWVCAPDPETDRPMFYSHVAKLSRFHHTSLVGGAGVIGAGEWIVRKGKLWKISANSGHYRPTIDFLYRAVLHMAGAFQADTIVYLYDNVDDKWVEYPVKEFINQPTRGGRYQTHPDAKMK